MKLYEVLTIVAVLAAPFLAVFIQRHLDIIREARGRKLWIFKTLMGTRNSRLSPDHVQALNMIDLEFTGNDKREKAVRKAWQEYLDHLGELTYLPLEEQQKQNDRWLEKCSEFLADLLYKMGLCVGYELDKVYLKKGIYSPKAHSEIEFENQIVRRLTMEVLAGRKPLVTQTSVVPLNEEAANAGKELIQSILAVLRGEQAIKTRQVDPTTPEKQG